MNLMLKASALQTITIILNTPARKNGILVYEHVKSSSFNSVGEQYLLISEDFSRMNWRIDMDDMINHKGSVRVLEYVSNPQKNSRDEAPLQLY